jgi:hypothetical protein
MAGFIEVLGRVASGVKRAHFGGGLAVGEGIVPQRPAQQAHAGDAPSKVFIEVDFATLGES